MPVLRSLAVGGAVLAGLALAVPAAAQNSQSASTSINIQAPALILTKTSDLSFGTIVRPVSGSGSIQIDANSGNVSTANLTLLAESPPTRAAFTVTGAPNANIQVTYPSSVNMTRSGGSETLGVTLTSSMGGGQIGSGGTVNFTMGGQVVVQSNTPTGAYSAVFEVTVNYN